MPCCVLKFDVLEPSMRLLATKLKHKTESSHLFQQAIQSIWQEGTFTNASTCLLGILIKSYFGGIDL